MGLLSDFIDRRRDEAIAGQIAEARGNVAVEPGLTVNGPFRGQPARGVLGEADADQNEAFSFALTQIPGMLQTGIQNQQDAYKQRALFAAQAAENTANIAGQNARHTADQKRQTAEFNEQQVLKNAERLEGAEKHKQDILLGNLDQQVKTLNLNEARKSSFRSAEIYSRLLPNDRATLDNGVAQTTMLKSMIQGWDDSFAFDVGSEGVLGAATSGLDAMLALNDLQNKENPTPMERRKLAYWQDVAEIELIFGQEISGADVAESQQEKIRLIVPNVFDDAQTIRNKMMRQFTNKNNELTRMSERITNADIRPQFNQSLEAIFPADPPEPGGFR